MSAHDPYRVPGINRTDGPTAVFTGGKVRRVALKPLDGSPAPDGAVALAGLRPDARYIAALTCPEGTTVTTRTKLLADLRAALPAGCSVVVLPHGSGFELFEDGPATPQARRPRLGEG